MSKSFMSEYKLSKPTDVRSNLTSLTLDVGNRGGNALNAKGNVDVTGNAILYGDLTINSGVGQGYGTGKITADSDVNFGGTATIAGNTEIGGTLTTTGVINAQGNIKLGNSSGDIGTMTYTNNNIITVKTGTNSTKTILFSDVASGGATSGEHFTLDICNALISFIPETSGVLNNVWGTIKRLGLGHTGVNNDSVKATLHVTDGDIFTNRGFKDIHGYGSNITQNVRYTLGQNSFGSAQNNFKLGTTDISNSDIFTVFNLNQTIDGSLSPVQIGSNLVDLTDASLSFCGSVFDGRYVYFIPSEFYAYGATSSPYKDNNKLIRYDTFVDFSNITSWQVIDLSNDISYNGTSLDLSGSYHGALFDGSAIYFSPFTNTENWGGAKNVANKQLLRYDPYHNFRSFGSAESYTTFDSGTDNVTDTSGGYNGNVYDGRYIYYVPGSATNGNPTVNGNGLDTHSTVLRYDTKSGFADGGSYNVCDLNDAASTNDKGYMGGCFDGQYVYFAPYKKTVISAERSFTHGYAVRYNTHSEFSSGNAASWNKFDLSANYASITGLLGSDGIDGGKNLTGYSGCVYDGRYVYYIPYEKSDVDNWQNGDFSANTTIARYDTQYNDASFSDVRAWSYYDLTHKFGSLDGGGSGLGLGDKMKGGFFGACYDGQNIWFIPSAAQFADGGGSNDKWSSLLVKYDTQQSFIDPSAYIGYDLSGLVGYDSDKLGGYRGCSFDGRYLYLTPWRRRTGTKDRTNGCVMRVDTGAPSQRLGINHLANSKELFIDSAGKVGIGTNTPDSNYLLDVSGSIAAHGDICGHDFYTQDISARNIYMQDIYSQDISARNIYLSNDISGLDASFHNLSVDRIYTDPAGKTLVIDSSLMITGGNVGIGVEPSYNCTLDISSVFGTGDSSIRLRRNGVRHWNIINDSTGAFKIQKLTGGNVSDISDCFAIYKTSGLGNADVNIPGRLKVGMNSDVDASHKLAVNGDICGNNLYVHDISASNIYVKDDICGNNLYIEDISASNIYVNTIYSNPSAGQALIIDSSLAIPDACFNILSDGKVGIGTTTPESALHVDGKIRIEDGEIGNISINGQKYACFAGKDQHNNTNFALAQRVGTGDTLLNAPSNKKISFLIGGDSGSGGNVKMTLDSSGNVGIGTTTPGYPLEVTTSVSSGTPTGNDVRFWYEAGVGGNNSFWQTWPQMWGSPPQDNAKPISIKATYGIWSGTAFYRSSDSRIKKDIEDVNDNEALDFVNKIPCRKYFYKDKYSEHKRIGFIAQEVREHLIQAVTLNKNIIPDEMREIENPQWTEGVDGKWILNIENLDFSSNHTGKCSFRLINDETDYDEIELTVNDDKKTFTFEKHYKLVFLVGKEVNDFHTLDKDIIFALHHAALQKVDRQLQAEKAKTATLETTVADLVARITALENA